MTRVSRTFIVEEKLYEDFKVYCVRKKTNVSNLIEGLMKQTLAGR